MVGTTKQRGGRRVGDDGRPARRRGRDEEVDQQSRGVLDKSCLGGACCEWEFRVAEWVARKQKGEAERR